MVTRFAGAFQKLILQVKLTVTVVAAASSWLKGQQSLEILHVDKRLFWLFAETHLHFPLHKTFKKKT